MTEHESRRETYFRLESADAKNSVPFKFLKNLCRRFIFFVLFVAGGTVLPTLPAYALNPGDVAIIGVRADDIDGTTQNGNDDAFAWVPLVDLPGGAQIFFTDAGWTSANIFRPQEGAIGYTAPAGGLAAGTVMLLEFSRTSSTGVYTFSPSGAGGTYTDADDANVGLTGVLPATPGDNFFIFEGSSASPAFIWAWKNDGPFDSNSTSNSTTALPSTLTEGVNAMTIELDEQGSDDSRYTGTTSGTPAQLAAAIANRANWEISEAIPFSSGGSDITNGTIGGGGFSVTPTDTTPPAASPTLNPAANAAGWNNADVTVTWNWADSGSGINIGNCTTSSTTTGEGTFNIAAACADQAGNVGNASIIVRVDKTLPAASPILDPAPNAAGWNNSDVTVTWNWTDSSSGIDAGNCTTGNITSAEGTTNVAATCADQAGNVGNANVTVNVDKTSPDTAITSNPPLTSPISTATFEFNGSDTISPAVALFCQLDGGGFNLCTSPVNLTGLGNGSHTFQVGAVDLAGNADQTPASYTWTVALNAAPVAVDDAYSVVPGTTLTIAAPGVLGNDTDAENNALTAAVVLTPSQGTLDLNSDGSFIYEAPIGFSRAGVTFTYQANDGTTDSNIATVTIHNQQSVCSGSNTLPANTWRMVSLSCLPPDATVGGVWADDLSGIFNTNWRVFEYDAVNRQYQQKALGDSVQQGNGYWIRHTDGGTWSVIGTPTPVVTQAANPFCASTQGCYEVDLVEPTSAQDLFNLVGNPFRLGVHWANVRLQVSELGATDVVYTPSEANAAAINIMSNTRWTYSGANYIACNDTGSPVQCDDMTATPAVGIYEGFWIKLLPGAFGKALKLLIPLAP